MLTTAAMKFVFHCIDHEGQSVLYQEVMESYLPRSWPLCDLDAVVCQLNSDRVTA
jgi:hypothetical protein